MTSTLANPPASATDGNDVTGFESLRRGLAVADNALPASGTMLLAYRTATAANAVACTKIKTHTSYTAAAATPTLCRMGLYTIDSSGNGTLVAACASDTTLWAATDTTYSRALASPSSYTPVPGQRYAFALLCVSGVAVPKFMGVTYGGNDVMDDAPRVAGRITGQTDLPATFTAAAVTTAAGNLPRVWIVP